ncbi:TetR/AcrR family transcriptional regulator [Paenibacillus sp. BK720]|uniref:TetR/AcrR family transcriptional regulator n=1 Tax=Paenibacillus sp. BK720 TaxID=2587092 RepID=UPI001421412D|nr:TetR/AcrR family transcriptional regulator [Paenibacillus sp. BK720]
MVQVEAKRGRPRNMETHKAILTASYDLLLESGFETVTVEKIAERAKVSKATIYKWWPNKAAVVMDGFLFAAAARLPVPDTGVAFNDIVIHASDLVRFLTSPEGRIIKDLIGGGQFDAGLSEAIRTRYVEPRRQEAGTLLARGVERGELNNKQDISLGIDMIYGPIFYRLLMTGGTLDDSYVKQLVTNVFEGIGSN